MIAKHPTNNGWIILQGEAKRLYEADWLIELDGQLVHPLFLYPVDFTAADIEPARQYAINYIRSQAAEAEAALDMILSGHHVRAIMLNTEIVEYYKAGRPANPAANVYVIAAAMATRRGIPLRDMLEILFAKWRIVQAEIAGIVTELDRLTEAIEAAATVAEIETILAGVDF